MCVLCRDVGSLEDVEGMFADILASSTSDTSVDETVRKNKQSMQTLINLVEVQVHSDLNSRALERQVANVAPNTKQAPCQLVG